MVISKNKGYNSKELKNMINSRIIYKDSHWKILYEQGIYKVKRREQRNKVR